MDSTTSAAIVVFPDTNVLLHYPYQDIDWCRELHADAVHLVVCYEVVRELDDKKSHPSLGERAEKVIKRIEAAEAQAEIHPGVTMEVFPKTVQAKGSQEGLSLDSMDDRIIRLVQQYAEEHADVEPRILSEDYGMRLRCRSVGMPVVEPPRSLRLPSPKSEDRKEIERLRREFLQVTTALPRLHLFVTASTTTELVEPLETLQPSAGLRDVETEVSEARARYLILRKPGERLKGDTLGAQAALARAMNWKSQVPDREHERYNAEVKSYFPRLQEALVAENAWIRDHVRMFRCGLLLENDGGAPAEDVDIHVEIPECVDILEIQDDEEADMSYETGHYLGAPTFPPIPKKPRSQQDRLERQMQESVMAARFQHRIERPPPDVEFSNDAERRELQISVRRLKHGRITRIATMWGRFRGDTEPHTFKAVVHFSIGNHPQTITDRLEWRFAPA